MGAGTHSGLTALNVAVTQWTHEPRWRDVDLPDAIRLAHVFLRALMSRLSRKSMWLHHAISIVGACRSNHSASICLACTQPGESGPTSTSLSEPYRYLSTPLRSSPPSMPAGLRPSTTDSRVIALMARPMLVSSVMLLRL